MLTRHRRSPGHGIHCDHHPSPGHRLRTFHLGNPREHVQGTLFNLHTPSPPQRGLQYPRNPFSFEALMRSLSSLPTTPSNGPPCSRLAPPRANKRQNGRKGTAPGPRPTSERVLQLLMRVYIIEGWLSAPKLAGLTTATGSGLGKTFSALRWKDMRRQASHALRRLCLIKYCPFSGEGERSLRGRNHGIRVDGTRSRYCSSSIWGGLHLEF